MSDISSVTSPKIEKSGIKPKIFLGLMLAGTVAAASGYALISKGGAPDNASGTAGAPFQPSSAPDKKTEAKASSKTAYKASTKGAAPAKSAQANAKKAGATATSSAAPTDSSEGASTPQSEAVKSEAAPKPPGKTASAAPKATSSAPAKVAAKAPKAEAPKTRLAAAPAMSAPTRSALAGDWPEYRGKLRDGISRETGWYKGGDPQMVWKANVGAGFASIVIANGRAYTMGNAGNQDTIWCFDAASGKGIWKQSYPCELMDIQHEGGPSATPVVDGNLLFTYSKRGHLHALDAATGRILWRKDIPGEMRGEIPQWGITSTPAVYGNSLYVMTGAPGACLTAFDKNSGRVLWQAGDAKPAYAALQVFDWKGTPYLGAFTAKGIEFHDVNNGKQLWSYNWKTAYDVNAAIPIVAGDKVFISSGYNTGCAMLQSTANNPLLWQNRNMRNHFNASVLLNGNLYGFDESDLACLDAQSGRKLWSQGRLGKGSLIAADNKLIILSERGELVIAEASPAGYKELGRSQILGGKCWTTPALANGRIYARNASGDLVCMKF